LPAGVDSANLAPLPGLGWFGPPQLTRPDLQRRARALWIVSWPFFAVVALVLSVAVIVEPDTLGRRATTVAAVGILISILHAMSRAGRPAAASWLLVLGLSVIVTQRAWITGGIHAPVAVFYALFILMGGVLLGPGGGFVTAAVCVAGAAVLTAGTAREWLAVPPGAGPALGGFVFVMLAIGLALVLQALVTFRPRRDARSVDAAQMLVHDMRSPMQVLLAHLEQLRDDVRGDSIEHVDGAIGGVTTLSRMTTSFLDVSRLEAGRMPVTRSRTDLAALAQSVVDSVRILQPARDISVDVDGPSICSCDAELTRRVIENLVINAIKHTDAAGRVRVMLTGSKSRMRLAVHDEGPGVAPEKRSAIFEPFSAESLRSASGHESSGLGLAFCRLAVQAQGGSIRVEDGTPRGSIFIVELPS
jgi:signal transduction histidine kinase